VFLTIEEESMEHKEYDLHLENRPAQLKKAKEKGVKIIGYFPGNYVPEEIIYASGAVPLCLIHGGRSEPVDAASAEMSSILCPFTRAQVGERLLKTNSYYSMIDMLVAPITCQHLKKAAEVLEYRGDIEVFKLGVPHQDDADFGLEYYANRLRALKERLQLSTGNEVTSERLHEAIDLYNRMRELLRKIALMRRSPRPPLKAKDFVRLNHASFYADPAFMVDILESAYSELKEQQGVTKKGVPRLLLIGPNMAYGDDKVLELVEAAGGEIVAEEVCEGMRAYWQGIENRGDPIQSLAKGYLVDRVPCAFMRFSAKKRFNFALNLIKDFDVSGVIWYELLGCETYDAESYFFMQRMGEQGIPMLVLESEYGTSDIGQLRIRIEAFMEQLRRVGDHD
jgi:benzoyl-CoA reductase/2-hydroxyglutaryl-CoA dehydratase subunit BcrC/BadD/HgdB